MNQEFSASLTEFYAPTLMTTYIEQRSYGTSYGGANWYREEVPYYPNYDRNRNGIPNNKEVDRNKDRKPDRANYNPNWNSGSNRDGYKTPDNNNFGDRNGNVYGR